MDGSFDGSIITDERVDGFMSGDGREDADLERKVKEATYVAEIEEIEKLTEALSRLRVARTDLSPEARKKGLAILAARRELVESLYDGRSIEEIREVAFVRAERAHVARTGQPLTPRAKAEIRGLKTYQSDRPCRNGHENPERNTSNSLCLECRRLNYERNHVPRKQLAAATI